MDKKELKDMSDAELLEELERLNNVVDDMFDDEEEDKQNILFFKYFFDFKNEPKTVFRKNPCDFFRLKISENEEDDGPYLINLNHRLKPFS